jgi:hypothetical protein
MKNKRYLFVGSALFATLSQLHAADVNVTVDITANTTWTANNTYILDKSIFVKSGATLTIEPGTTILGTQNVTNNTYGSLIITRNGKIHAEGTAEKPIVMTAKEERDNEGTVDELDPAAGDGGFWGGLIILGNAPINFYTGPTTNANENSIEGFPGGSTSDILYGGTNSSDNSGIVKYVSIRFGGYVYQSGKEINGLTMGGVGSGTTIENVEVVSNTDDGVEIFGGTVNTKRIAVAFCQDDSFDLDEGHQGYHQFWFAIQNANGSYGDRGGEWDGGNKASTGGGVVTGTPYTTTTIYNATFIGDSASVGGNSAFYIDDNFAGQLHNSVVHQFSGSAVAVDAADGIGATPDPLFQNVTFGTIAGGAGALASVSGTGVSTLSTDPMLGGISRTNDGGLDPRPNAASPLYSSTLSPTANGYFDAVNYRGAFGATNWLDGWSYLSKKGYFGNLATLPSTGGSAPFADADGDGISDTLEATTALTALGFSSRVNNTGSGSNLFEDLYTETSIQSLRGTGLMIEANGTGPVTLTLPLFKSTDLINWTPAGNATATTPFVSGKQFYRVDLSSGAANQ